MDGATSSPRRELPAREGQAKIRWSVLEQRVDDADAVRVGHLFQLVEGEYARRRTRRNGRDQLPGALDRGLRRAVIGEVLVDRDPGLAEGVRETGVERFGAVVLLHGQPSGRDALGVEAAAVVREQGGLAKSGGCPQHYDGALRREEAGHQFGAREVSRRRARYRDLLTGKPGWCAFQGFLQTDPGFVDSPSGALPYIGSVL